MPLGVAREIAQYFRGSTEWTFAVDHPLTVTQRRQIRCEGLRIGERGVLAEELQLSCTMILSGNGRCFAHGGAPEIGRPSLFRAIVFGCARWRNGPRQSSVVGAQCLNPDL